MFFVMLWFVCGHLAMLLGEIYDQVNDCSYDNSSGDKILIYLICYLTGPFMLTLIFTMLVLKSISRSGD